MNEKMLIIYIAAMVLTFVITAISARILIPKLKSIKMGQKILDIGPRWHKSKEGTPTMGGLTFIIATAITAVALMIYGMVTKQSFNFAVLITSYLFMLANGAIGFADDYIKFIKKQNEGFSAVQKYLFQTVAAIAFLFVMTKIGAINTCMAIPFTDFSVDMGFAYYILAFILITGIVNSVNLTDGIDGLASSVTFIVAAFFAVIAFRTVNSEAAIVSALTVGACLGFLVYNFHPARIFMGDTGSLFLGGAVVAMAFLVNNPLIVVLTGFIYICESLSDIIQVTVYKLTPDHRRFFKMAPIHHHFEKCGWGEVKIVAAFSAVTLVMSIIAYFGFFSIC